jgi:hypothetical protein
LESEVRRKIGGDLNPPPIAVHHIYDLVGDLNLFSKKKEGTSLLSSSALCFVFAKMGMLPE